MVAMSRLSLNFVLRPDTTGRRTANGLADFQRMMKHKILPLLLALCPVAAGAQHNLHPNAANLPTELALCLLDEHHTYGAATANLPHAALPTAEQLVADYRLRQPGTAERIGLWLAEHPVHPLAQRLALMQANLLVREGQERQALALYSQTSLTNLPADEHCEARLYEGIASIHTGQLVRAEQILRSIEHEATHGMDVQYYLGYVNYAQGRFAEALPYFTAAASSYDYRRTAPVYLADCQVQTGQCADAIRTLQQWRRATGSTLFASEANRVEGEALYGVGHYDEAIRLLSNYVRSADQPTRQALYKLGMSQMQTEDYGQAALHLSRSASTARDAMAQNAWLHAGIAYVALGQKQQARIAFQQASETEHDRAVQEEALYNYALTLHEGASMGFGESVTVFERFLNTFPQSKYAPQVTAHLAEVYLTTKNYEAALASINKIQRPTSQMLDVKQQVLYNLGAQKYADGHNHTAIQHLSQSIALRPTPEAYYWKGEAEYRLGNYRQAESDLRKGVQSMQYRTPATYALGYALLKQKKYADALPQFVSVAGSTAEPSLRADAYSRMGDCQYVARMYDAAYNSYQRALDTDRRSADYALLQQAFIQGLKGNYQKKAELLTDFDAQYGTTSSLSADAMFEKGRAYVQTGQKARALETFAALRQQFPQSVLARRAANEQALLQHDAGRTDEAIATYRSVIQNHPNTAEAQTALANLKDIFTAQGRVNEFAALAAQAGQALSPREIDEMTANAALRATSAGNHQQAAAYYSQLEAQTQSSETRRAAQLGLLRAAQAMKDHNLTAQTATRLLDHSHASGEVASEARLARAQALMAMGDTQHGVADLQVLSSDQRTVYGAQAVVMLAQYAYDTQQYQSAEQVLTPFIDSGTTHSYWLARAFVLLSDVYAKTGRTVEARQYLLSLRSNYTESEEINRMIEQRLKSEK